MIDKELLKDDELKYRLSLRSKNKPASCFDWHNALMADGVPIFARQKTTYSDPNIRVSYNNFQVIQKTKSGYLAGDIQRTYTDSIAEEVKEKYKEFDNLNHFKSFLKRLMFSCTGWGNTYSLCYLDEQNRARIKQIPAWQGKVVYNHDNEPIKAYVYYDIDERRHIWEYDSLNVTEWLASKSGNSYQVLVETKPHGFIGIPLVEWSNNDNKQGNAELAVGLMDAYDRLISDNITEAATFRAAYLLLKNMGVIDDKTKAEMQKSGVFAGGADADAHFITKDINPEFIKFIVQKTWSGIWIVSSSVDPEAVSNLQNATAFQISQMYRNMEEDCKDTEAEWKISLEYLDRLLKSYWTGLDIKSVADFSTEDINYDFKRNIPKDVMTWLKDMLAAGGKLPQKEIFIKAGYDEKKAEELVQEAETESYETLTSEI
ncbi:MAG TPA: phage portal protein [Candidatus Limenecus avicola]|uniref:Phage portal protein n=1 Tax=Candidatus Limenecus avicola TaxID=2840847 RepID=A0A9D1MZQ5_9CLOT|nr:phage portal protein [Candidatus Limenecus avicola]